MNWVAVMQYAVRGASWLIAGVVCLSGLGASPQNASVSELPRSPLRSAKAPPSGDVATRVARGIEQLGAESYIERERAQEELRRLGIEAFDALLDAQYHEDIEIALRARYLLRSLPIHWVEQADPPAVKSLLRNYDGASRDERKRQMEQLAALEDSLGVPALCRVMRFEVERVLSKEAALLAISHLAPQDMLMRNRLAEVVRASVANSTRPAARWLIVYARTLHDAEAALDDWELISTEEDRLLTRRPEETDRRIVQDLLRWRAQLLLDLSRSDEARVVIRQVLERTADDRQELLRILDWSLERQAWFVADEAAARFPGRFREDPLLLYGWAEALTNSQQKDRAEETAQRALQMQSGRHEQHLDAAKRLTDHLQFVWAERELRQVMAATQPAESFGFQARLMLSSLLFDLQRERDSAETLKTIVDAMEREPGLWQDGENYPGSLRALWHYRCAMHSGRVGDRQQQRTHLEEAIRHNPRDADVLIAMHRLPDADPPWREMTRNRIQEMSRNSLQAAKKYEAFAKNPLQQRLRMESDERLANLCNEFAWLVSNTEGDFQEALRSSQRSLELSPDNPAYLDTLARCYYALGDLANAVKHQARAVRLEPSSQQMRRQLKLFERSLSKSPDKPSGSSHGF